MGSEMCIRDRKKGNSVTAEVPKDQPRKLKYKEKQELEKLPAQIEKLEEDIAAIHTQMAEPEFYKGEGEMIAEVQSKLSKLDNELKSAYARWEELESLATG